MTITQSTKLALDHLDSCPVCSKTCKSIDELNVEIE